MIVKEREPFMGWSRNFADALGEKSITVFPEQKEGVEISREIQPLSLPPPRIKLIGDRKSGGGAGFQIGDVLLDCGANPSGGMLAQEQMNRMIWNLVQLPVTEIAISHYHLDHHGGLPILLQAYRQKRIPLPVIVCSKTTWRLLKRHLVDAGFFPDGLEGDPLTVIHRERTERLSLIKNKHSVPGSCCVLYQDASRRILYTGDWWRIDLPPNFPRVDLCITDSTGGTKDWVRDDKERFIRDNVMRLAVDALEKDSLARVYISTFSTNIKRICHWETFSREHLGFLPCIEGSSMFHNLAAYRGEERKGIENDRLVICTGAWAQGLNDDREGVFPSRLVQISLDEDKYYRINRGDRVILSASMPIWQPAMMQSITEMCQNLHSLEAEVIIDSSLELPSLPFARREEVHCGGHTNFPGITKFLEQLKAPKVFATHGDEESLKRVEEFCRASGMEAVGMEGPFLKF